MVGAQSSYSSCELLVWYSNNNYSAAVRMLSVPVYRGGYRPLPASAVSILCAWFDEHREHPYVDGVEAAALAERCQISVTQLRKWLANRRLRTNSTKHIAEIVNRRRLKATARRRHGNSRCPPSERRWLAADVGHVIYRRRRLFLLTDWAQCDEGFLSIRYCATAEDNKVDINTYERLKIILIYCNRMI